MTTLAAPIPTRLARDGRPAPRWATLAAHLVPLVVLPAGRWRIGLALGFSMRMVENGHAAHVHGRQSVYVVA